jgi:hypothetical protein
VLVIFIPLALFLYFLYPHTVGSSNFEFGGIICAHFVFNYAFYFNYGLFSSVSLIYEHMITLFREFKLCYFLWQHEILQFNLIFTSTFGT